MVTEMSHQQFMFKSLDVGVPCSNLPAWILKSRRYQKGFPFVDPFLYPLQMSEKQRSTKLRAIFSFYTPGNITKAKVFRCFQGLQKDRINRNR